jgi:NlpC/P60 family
VARHTFLNRCKVLGIGALVALVLHAGAWSAPAAEETGQRDPLLEFLQSSGLAARQFLPDTQPLVQGVRDRASELVLSAMDFLGVPYRRGGNSAAQGFDCSGFTRFVFEHSLGLVLPRRSDEQARAPGTATVARAELKPGDLVFFNTLRRTFSHVGIYIGDGKFIHSPRSGETVRIDDMRAAYWNKRFTGARRVDGVNAENAAQMLSRLPETLSPPVDASRPGP